MSFLKPITSTANMTPTEPPQWCDIKSAMRFAGVSRRTIYNWYDRGLLRTARTPSGCLRIDRRTLVRPERVA
jgi:predicted DNA-binding transcriptional regulator AlpA